MVCLAALLASCGGVASSLDAKSEGDEVRDQSLALFLDRTMTDSLDGGDGDNTDWKYLDIVDKGGLRVDVGIDAPEGLKGGEVELFDEFGKRLDRRIILPNQTSYSFELDVEKIPNKYFVRTFTQEGRTSYSIGARLAPDPGQPPPRPVAAAQVVEVEPEPDVAPVSCPAGMTLRGKHCICPAGLVRSGSKCVEKKVVPVAQPVAVVTSAPPPVAVAVATNPPPPVQQAQGTKQTVTGSVVRVVPSEDGRSATISIRLDADFNMVKGAQGTLFKSGNEESRFVVTKARGRQALATVNMSTADLTTGGGKLTVRIVGE